MYRPTVRYDDVYKQYVDRLFQVTPLDRNQIIRAALFNAAHSNLFHEMIRPYLRGDVPLPSPLWSASDHRLWLEQTQTQDKGGKDVNGQQEVRRTQEEDRRQQQAQGRIRKVRENGGIKITFG